MEVTFDSMADWEAFLGALPFQEHKAWTQRIQGMVVDGSPMWQVHRSVPVMASGAAHTAASVGIVSNSPKRQAQPAASPQLVFTDQVGRGMGSVPSALPALYEALHLLAMFLQCTLERAMLGHLEGSAMNHAMLLAPAGCLHLPDMQVSPEDIFAWQHSTGKPSDRQQRQQEQTSPAAAPAEGVPLDWKGEPMKLNPGDTADGVEP